MPSMQPQEHACGGRPLAAPDAKRESRSLAAQAPPRRTQVQRPGPACTRSASGCFGSRILHSGWRQVQARRGSETQASDGPASKPAIGGGGGESHKEVRKPVGDGSALDAGGLRKAGSETQASDGPASKPATGGGGRESHKEVRKPVGHGKAAAAGDEPPAATLTKGPHSSKARHILAAHSM